MTQRARPEDHIHGPLLPNPIVTYGDSESDDPDVHVSRYDTLQMQVQDSPPLIVEGDQKIGPLAQLRCLVCGAVIGALFVMDARPRGAALAFVAWTQRKPVIDGAYRRVPVVLAAPADPDRGRLPIPVPALMTTTCRAHGSRQVHTERALDVARAALSRFDAGDGGKAIRLNV